MINKTVHRITFTHCDPVKKFLVINELLVSSRADPYVCYYIPVDE